MQRPVSGIFYCVIDNIVKQVDDMRFICSNNMPIGMQTEGDSAPYGSNRYCKAFGNTLQQQVYICS